jgi:hypothetical protein
MPYLTVNMTKVTAAAVLHENAFVAQTPCGHAPSPVPVPKWDRTRSCRVGERY